MIVAVYLPGTLLSHLRGALTEEYILAVADSWPVLREIVRRRAVDVVIVDPSASGVSDVKEVTAMAEQYPSLPILVYTVLAPAALRAAAELSKRGMQQVVLHRFDDAPNRLKELLERTPGHRLGGAVLERLAGPLGRLPVVLVRAVEQLFEAPHVFPSALDLAQAVGMPVTRMYRKFQQAGLPSPRRLLVAARLLRAYGYMRDPGYSVEDIAAKLGYSNPRILTRNALQALKLRPTAVRRELGENDVVSRLVEWIGGSDDDDDGLE